MSSVRTSSFAELIYSGVSETSTSARMGVKRADFACYTAFEQYGRVVVDELELLQYLDPLFVVGDEFEVLFGDREL